MVGESSTINTFLMRGTGPIRLLEYTLGVLRKNLRFDIKHPEIDLFGLDDAGPNGIADEAGHIMYSEPLH
jgi:hypothetical protein